MSVVYDTGVLIAADRSDRMTWAEHRVRLETGVVPVTTAPVVAQASRSTRQVQLHRWLRGCAVVGFAPDQAHAVGALLGRTGHSDVVDAHVFAVAALTAATVLTADADDLARLSACLDDPVVIVSI